MPALMICLICFMRTELFVAEGTQISCNKLNMTVKSRGLLPSKTTPSAIDADDQKQSYIIMRYVLKRMCVEKCVSYTISDMYMY